MMTSEKKSELLKSCSEILESLVTDPKSKNDMAVFYKLYSQFLEEPATIDWNSWTLPEESDFIESDDLPMVEESEAKNLLNRLAVVRLNGGLGTTMGCSGPKSLITVKNGFTFLDIALRQVSSLNEKYYCNIPILLMESFNTLEKTKNYLLKNKIENLEIIQFEQSKCPRIFEDNLLPVPYDGPDKSEFHYPPGHGNIFETLLTSDLADELLRKKKDILFVSNIDNTGATVDPRFIKALIDGNREYMMEVTEKTPADIKGGTLIKIGGRFMHLEMPQVPPEGIEEFCSTKTFKIFNTNNIWIDLKAIRPRLGEIKREIIANKKTLSTGEKIIQLETSIGGAIRNFPKACGLKVSRSRFLPVKRTQDLLLVSSDIFELNNEGNVYLVKTRKTVPLISLSKEFDDFLEFQKRFKNVPSLKEVESLTVTGDVWFGQNVVLKGKVKLEAKEGDTVILKDGETVTQN